MAVATLGAALGLGIGRIGCTAPLSHSIVCIPKSSHQSHNSRHLHLHALSKVEATSSMFEDWKPKRKKEIQTRRKFDTALRLNNTRRLDADGLPSQQDDDLPEELYSLLDPSQPSQLGILRVKGQLDFQKLGDLVFRLGANVATWPRIITLFGWLKKSGHQLDEGFCCKLIRVLAGRRDVVSALGVYEWMLTPKAAGGGELKIQAKTYEAAMRAAMSSKLYHRALQVWEDSKRSRTPPDSRLCLTYIQVCEKLGQRDKVMNMYREMQSAPPSSQISPTVHVYTTVMKTLTNSGAPSKALEVWGDMIRAGIEPSGPAYTTAIKICAVTCDWTRALALFEEMCAKGGTPDLKSCTALIAALASAGEADKAQGVVEWMLMNNLSPNVTTYNTLIRAMCNAREWRQVMETIYLMQLPEWGGVKPNVYTYSTLLKALGEQGQWQLAEAIFQHLEAQVLSSSSSKSTRRTANLRLFPVTSNAKPVAEVSEVPDNPDGGSSRGSSSTSGNTSTSESDLDGVSLLPTSGTETGPGGQEYEVSNTGSQYKTAIMSFYRRPGSRRSQLRQPPSASSESGTTPPQGTSTVDRSPLPLDTSSGASSPLLLQCLSIQASASIADQLSAMSTLAALRPMTDRYMRKAKQRPRGFSRRRCEENTQDAFRGPRGELIMNGSVCCALMFAFDKCGRWEEAVGVLDRARKLGLKLDQRMYSIAMLAAGKAGKLEVVEQLRKQIRDPDTTSYGALITAYGMAGQPAQAEAYFQEMVQERGLVPQDYAYCSLIVAHSLSGDFKSALAIQQRMRAAGVPLTVHVYNALLAACERGGQYDRALELYRGMAQEGVTPNLVTQQLMRVVGERGVATIESQQFATAALSATLAAVGSVLIQKGIL